MKYKCTDCGKVYNDKVDFCECGNDKFNILSPKSNTHNSELKVSYQYQEEEKKENPLFLIIFIIFLCALMYFIMQKIMNYKTVNNEGRQEYIDKLQTYLFKDFDPKGIENSGYCIISFEVDANGVLHNKKFIKTSQVQMFDQKIHDIMSNIKSFEKPPASFINEPISFEFGCIANGQEIECYNKPYKKH